MRPTPRLAALATLLALLAATPPTQTTAAGSDEDGFVPLFNGKDLAGWELVNTPSSTFFARDGQLVTTGKPTGYLRTARQYENFIAEFDWMHVPERPGAVGNSGFFVWADPVPAVGTGYTRGIEVQVLVNLTYKNKKGEVTATSQGDLFSIWGATCVPERPHPEGWARCLPSGDFCKGEREWNHYRVEANHGTITLLVNGHRVSSVSQCRPRAGYLALESEGSECRFRDLRIKELPSTGPGPNEAAEQDAGFRALFDGASLAGWAQGPEGLWHVKGERLAAVGAEPLMTQRRFGAVEVFFDWRVPPKAGAGAEFAVLVGGRREPVKLPAGAAPGSWQRHKVQSDGATGPSPIEFHPAEGLEVMNVYVREVK